VAQADCTGESNGGATALGVSVPERARYRFEVVRSNPDGASQIPGGDTTLFVRRDCRDPLSQLACNEDIDAAAGNFLSRFEVDLDPGDYTVLSTTRAVLSPADVTVRWGRADAWSTQPPSTPAPLPSTEPRLMVGGLDVTPPEEPQPNLAIDRLVDVPVVFGTMRTARVLLAGECLGTQADLQGGASCVDAAGERVPVALATTRDGIGARGASAVGRWAAAAPAPCTVARRTGSMGAGGAPLYDEEVCIPGGAFLLGSLDTIGGGARDTFPRQPVALAPFLLDRYEVTVGRYRQALRDGFVPPHYAEPIPNDGPLFTSVDPRTSCSFSGDASGPAAGVDRERLPLSCIGWYGAQALCRFLGGDLPSHAEWEYAAAVAGRPARTEFAWGDQQPDCSRAVYGRGAGACGGDGPAPVDALPWAAGDVTPLGVVGMGGNVAEWTQDSFRGYADACWWSHPLHGVGCQETLAPERSMRGSDWGEPSSTLLASDTVGQPPSYPLGTFGLRCRRRGVP
jgi:formylglycine-generating enzyme required for sulfatase activity